MSHTPPQDGAESPSGIRNSSTRKPLCCASRTRCISRGLLDICVTARHAGTRTSTLRICSVVRPLTHESVWEYVSDLFKTIDRDDRLYAGELVELAILGSSDRRPYSSYKAPPRQSPRSERRPQGVVFEPGFAEPYQELVQDAFQWLLKGPDIQLVTSCGSKPASQRRIDELIWRFGNKQFRELLKEEPGFADRELSIGEKPKGSPCCSDSDVENWDEIWDEIAENVHGDDWMGPLSAFVEFWRLREGRLDVDGVRVSLLPDLHDANPTTNITDLLPSRERAELELTFDLTEYRRAVTAGDSLKQYGISDGSSQSEDRQGGQKDMAGSNGGGGAVGA
ncbi:hypothetical protein FN846DRAFT_1025122 [Sphaerosporella brunnea]|uniref:Uncharacterized protein n=1 Tax=Sphaerosporella brunnea TaxID=1250544 RepID=A0A5J5EFC7_9PEZI|nr:hypothetical protein FN846DRAFT_1025122 [Sphaerosporella brunnea]